MLANLCHRRAPAPPPRGPTPWGYLRARGPVWSRDRALLSPEGSHVRQASPHQDARVLMARRPPPDHAGLWACGSRESPKKRWFQGGLPSLLLPRSPTEPRKRREPSARSVGQARGRRGCWKDGRGEGHAGRAFRGAGLQAGWQKSPFSLEERGSGAKASHPPSGGGTSVEPRPGPFTKRTPEAVLQPWEGSVAVPDSAGFEALHAFTGRPGGRSPSPPGRPWHRARLRVWDRKSL